MNSNLKVILVGNGKVGKTSLIHQLIEKNFKIDYLMNTSVDKFKKIIEIDNVKLNLEIWDTIGQEIFASINKIFMKNSNIAILVYDSTSKESFLKLDNWYKQITDINNKKNIIIGICGNKSDLFEKQVVSKIDGEKYAKEKNIPFFETSAKDYNSVYNVFYQLGKEYINKENELQKRILNNQISIDDSELIRNRENRKKSIFIVKEKNRNKNSFNQDYIDNNNNINKENNVKNSKENNNNNMNKEKKCC